MNGEMNLDELEKVQGGNPLSYDENKAKFLLDQMIEDAKSNNRELTEEELKGYMAGLTSDQLKMLQSEVHEMQEKRSTHR